MNRKNPLPMITDCFAPAPRSVSLNDHRITQALFAFLVFGLLSVAHIYLQFCIRDVKTQHQKLQEQCRNLRQEESRLQHENEALCDAAQLRDWARHERQMVESDPKTQTVAALPDSLKEKYVADAKVRGRDETLDFATVGETQDAPVTRLLLSLVDVNKAFAASPQASSKTR